MWCLRKPEDMRSHGARVTLCCVTPNVGAGDWALVVYVQPLNQLFIPQTLKFYIYAKTCLDIQKVSIKQPNLLLMQTFL